MPAPPHSAICSVLLQTAVSFSWHIGHARNACHVGARAVNTHVHARKHHVATCTCVCVSACARVHPFAPQACTDSLTVQMAKKAAHSPSSTDVPVPNTTAMDSEAYCHLGHHICARREKLRSKPPDEKTRVPTLDPDWLAAALGNTRRRTKPWRRPATKLPFKRDAHEVDVDQATAAKRDEHRHQATTSRGARSPPRTGKTRAERQPQPQRDSPRNFTHS